jgi:hypothetical protein
MTLDPAFGEHRLDFSDGCEECRRLSAAYEAATMEWFRLQGQLRIAEYSREQEASHQIVAELNVVSRRRQALREEEEQHRLLQHPRTSTARGQ